MKSITLCLLIWVSLMFYPGFFLGETSCFIARVHAEDEGDRIVVEGEGEAEIGEQDFGRARKKALNLAKTTAFSKALAECAPVPLSLSEQQVLLSELIPRINEFLVQYRFEEMPAAGVMFVTVEAVFSRSSFREEFRKRGLFLGQGESQEEPTEIFLTLQGIQSIRAYRDILRELPRRMEQIQSLVPYEIYGDELVLKAMARGDDGTLESAVRHALTEMAPWGSTRGDAVTISISTIPPGKAPVEEPAAPEGAPQENVTPGTSR